MYRTNSIGDDGGLNLMITPYYDDDGITLYQGDCLDIMPQLASQSINAVVCDLPYGTTDASWDSVIPLDALWREYKRLCKPNAAIVLNAREPFTSVLVTSNIKAYRHKWVWDKKQTGNFALAKYMPLQVDEDVIVFGLDTVNYYPEMRTGVYRNKGSYCGGEELISGIKKGIMNYNDQYYPTNILSIANLRDKTHPTQKPTELLQYLIRTYTKPGDTILDNTCGSGTTLLAAKLEGRKCIGIERDTGKDGECLGYCEYAVSRLAQSCMIFV